jgi:hypothetical protein
MSLGNALARLDGKSELTADDSRMLRQIVYGDDSKIAQAEAETLFKLNADAGSHSQEWRQFFVEAMTDYVVRQAAPSGYIDQANADWLVNQMRKIGQVREDEIEMLIHSLEVAEESPPALQSFVLELVKNTVLAKLKQNQGLDGRDVERLRRVIFSRGGDGNIAVTRHEAETLFDINDALNGADADSAWIELFKRAVANAVLFESTWHSDRKTAQKREAWLADTSVHPLRFMAGVASPGAWKAMSEEARDLVHLDFRDHSLDVAYTAQEMVKTSAERLTDDETHWLLERLRRNGAQDKNERAVVGYIRDNAQDSGSQVETLISGLDRLAPAATQR